MTIAVLDKQDSSKFKEQPMEDPSIDFSAEGGYNISRPRYTRATPRVFEMGFTNISDADKVLIETLYSTARGSSDSIGSWTHPVSSESITLRFSKGKIPTYKYKGIGGLDKWDVNIIVEEI